MLGSLVAELFPDHPYVLDSLLPRPGRGRFVPRQRRGGPTSSGTLHHSSVHQRRAALAELRTEYHNGVVRMHNELARIKAEGGGHAAADADAAADAGAAADAVVVDCCLAAVKGHGGRS